MDVERNRTCARAIQSSRKKAARVALLAYVETGTTSYIYYLKYI